MSVVRAATCAVISYCSTHIPPTRGTNTNMNCSTGICSYVNGVSLPPMIGIMTVSPMIGIITVSPTFLLPVRQKRYVNCQLMPTKTLPINGDINYSDSLLSYFSWSSTNPAQCSSSSTSSISGGSSTIIISSIISSSRSSSSSRRTTNM